MSSLDIPFPFLGTMAQDQLAGAFFPWWGWALEGLEVLLMGMGLIVQTHGLGKLSVSGALHHRGQDLQTLEGH